jgi:hypothetical protein
MYGEMVTEACRKVYDSLALVRTDISEERLHHQVKETTVARCSLRRPS